MQFRPIDVALMLSARAALQMIQRVEQQLLPARPQHKSGSAPHALAPAPMPGATPLN